MTDTRLPAAIEQMLVDVAADPAHHDFRRRRLDFGGDRGMRDTFLQALASPGIETHVDVCEDDPGEIVVRASGTDAQGRGWRDLNIILLDPCWSRIADASQTLAEDIVEHWTALQAAYATMAVDA